VLKHPLSGKLELDGREGSDFHLLFPSNAVAKQLTIPILVDQGTPIVSVKIEEVYRILVIDSGILQPGVSSTCRVFFYNSVWCDRW
jgi:hypothetical protein